MLLNTQQDERLWKVLCYGESGVGKTHLGVTAPDPVILLAERQGFETVRDAAHMLGKPTPPTFWMRNLQDFRTAIQVLQNDPAPLATLVQRLAGDATEEEVDAEMESLPYVRPKTVVIDSCTEVFQLIWDNLLEQAPPKTAKDGLPDTSMRHWSAMRDRASGLIRTCRDLPYHVLFLALLDDREQGEAEQKTRIVQPQAPMRAIPSMLVAACNAAGVVRRDRVTVADENDPSGRRIEVRRSVRFLCPSFVLAKPLHPLAPEEVPDVSDWFRRLERPTGDPVVDALEAAADATERAAEAIAAENQELADAV